MFKARMKFSKTGRAKYISHLDVMHVMQRSIARAGLPVWFTEGFNQHAYISVALPLATCFSGECEFLDFHMLADTVPADAADRMNAAFPEGFYAYEIYDIADGGMKIRDIGFSRYRIICTLDQGVPEGFVESCRALFQQEELLVMKKSKRGEKLVNMQDLLRGVTFAAGEHTMEIQAVCAAGQENLSPEYVVKAIRDHLPEVSIDGVSYHRQMVYTKDGKEFR